MRSRAISTGAFRSRSPGYEDHDDKRIYVWFDAVIGYLSASIEWAANRGTPDAWREWWQNPDAEHAYFMGKDNIVFHTVIWPSILLGYGDDGDYGAGRGALELPDNIVSSEFLTMEGKKFSSSRGVEILVRDFLSRYDPDALRYFLSIAGPETQDTDFTWSEFVRRNNDELVATWGNLVNRTLQSAYKNFGTVPEPGALTDADRALLEEVERGFDSVGSLIEAARFKNALQEAMRLAGLGNQYVAEQAPWAHARDRPRARGHDPLRRAAGDRQPEGPAHAVPARSRRSGCTSCSATTGCSPARSSSGRCRRTTGRSTSCSPATTRAGSAAGSRARFRRGRRCASRSPLFAKLDPEQVVADELAADGSDADGRAA